MGSNRIHKSMGYLILIRELALKFCETNQKYDVFIDQQYVGKHYTIEEALKQIQRRVDYDKNKNGKDKGKSV